MCVVHSTPVEDPSLEQAFIAELDHMRVTNNFNVEKIRHMTTQRPEMPKPHEVLGLVLWEEAGDNEDKMAEALGELLVAFGLYNHCGVDPKGLKILEGDIFEAKGKLAIKRGHKASGVAALERALRLFTEGIEASKKNISLDDLEKLIAANQVKKGP